MKRPQVWITVGYIIGIIWGLYLKISIVPIFLLLGVIILYKKKSLCILLFIVFACISNTQIHLLEEKYENLYNNLEQIEVIGVVISDKKETNYKASYTLEVESVNGNKKYKGTKLLIYTSKDANLNYADKVQLVGEFKKANQARNYREFDYREYLKQKNIYGIINVEKINLIRHQNFNKTSIFFYDLRNKIKNNLKEVLGEEAKITIGILLRRYNRNSRRGY